MKRMVMVMLGVLAVFNCSSGVGNILADIDRAVAGTYSAQNSTSTRYIVPVISKTDAELGATGYTVIHTAQEFIDAINDDPFAEVALGEDIDFNGIDYTSLWTDDDPFSGIVNGNGYKIKNLTIDSTEEYVGLFGATDGATIENAILENVKIKGDRCVGALVGKAFSTTITNSYVLGGTVEGNNNVGGLIGYADSSEITTSYTELDLVKANMSGAGGFIGDILKTNINQSYAKATVETDVRGGVFTGGNNSSNIENSFACGEVIGRSGIGGFSGRNVATTIIHSYSSVNVTGTTDVGAFIGEFVGNSVNNKVEDSFFDSDVAGVTDVVGSYYSADATQVATLKGITTSKMKTPSTFTDVGWSADVWHFYDGMTPQLMIVPTQNSADATRYIVPIRQKTDAELEEEGYTVVHTAQEFIDAINYDLWGSYALGSDINLEGIDYVPLGDNANFFAGILNGNGYKIKNLTIDSTEEYVGLFGSAEYATIENVILENVNIKGDRYVGALVGKAFSTTITNSYVLGGTVEGNNNVGGLIGYADSSEITTSYIELDLVKANMSDAGGFIGDILKTNISKSYAKTTVETDGRGGVFTGGNNSSNIENSFACGEVIGRSGIGGFSGRNVATTIIHSYSSVNVIGTTDVGAFIGEFVGNSVNNKVEDSFFDSDVAGVTDVVGSYYSADATQVATLKGITTSKMKTPSTFTDVGWSADVWHFYDGMTPQLMVVPTQNSADATRYIVPIRQKTDAELEEEGYTVVHTAQEFIDLLDADSTAAIALGADIDFAGITYIPFDQYTPFAGFLDGNGYKIKNLTIDSTEEYVGLFGSAEYATIENAILENVNIKGDRYVGALVGKAFSTTITNCGVIGGTVEGNVAVGGLVGYIDSSEITTSYTELDLVKANTSDAGGFIGYILKTKVNQSYSKTDVETDLRAGVFSGTNNSSMIKNSFATGEVIGREGIGGFSGTNISTTISDSYSSVKITGEGNVGAFIGEFLGNSALNIVTNSFFDSEVAGMTDAVGTFYSADATRVATLNGITTSKMKTPSTFTDVGWSADVWHFYDGMTPQLMVVPTQNSADATRYIVPIRQKTDAELEEEGYTVVHTAQEFIVAINDDMGGYYALGADIDFNGIDYTSLGNNIDSFGGELNGNGYKIKNITVNSTEEYTGLFGSTNNAYIENVILENVKIKGDRYVGALVGKAFSTTITNCGVIGGTVEGNVAVGGLVGYIDSSEIATSYTELDLVKANTSDAGGFIGYILKTKVNQSYSKTDVETDINGGAFSGCNNASNIKNSFSIGEVIGRQGIGGFSGTNIITPISNSYSSAKVTGTRHVGAFIGEFVGNSVNNKVEDSFFDSDVAGVTDVVGAYYTADATQVATLKGISTSQMTTPTTFTDAGWNTEVWHFYEGMMPQLMLAPAESGKWSQDIEWTCSEGSGDLYIEGVKALPDRVVLPDVPDIEKRGHIGSFDSEVTFAAWHPYRHSITNVVISQGVTEIGSYAFWDHRNMKSVSIPDSVYRIDNFAFASCSNLTSVSLSYWFRSLDSTAFVDCPKLERISVNETNHWFQSIDGVLYGPKEGTISYKYQKKDVLLRCPPARYTDGRVYDVSDSAIEIGDYSFMGCSGIGVVNIPDTVLRIGEQAFDGCTGLVHIELPSSVTIVDSYAFKDCANLKSVVLSSSLGSLSSSVFMGCSALETIFMHADTQFDAASLPASVSIIRWKTTEVGTLVISGRGVIPAKDEYPWSGEKDAVLRVEFGEGITEIGEDAFAGFESLALVKLPGSIAKLVDGAFRDCAALKKVYVPTNLKGMIPPSAFDGCPDDLVVVYYGDGVEVEIPLKGKVRFDANGGTVQSEPVDLIGGVVSASLPVPRRAGYRFDGWFTEKDGGVEVYAGSIVTATTLYAHWRKLAGLIRAVTPKSDAELEAEGYTVVHTAQEFIDAIDYDLWGSYALGADINFEGIDCVPLGDDIDYFAGVLNGNGYKIKNLTIDSSEEDVGLFGAAEYAIIENVILENVKIKGDRYVGALVGEAFSTTITNCGVIGGTVEGNVAVGGLVGYIYSSEILEVQVVSVGVTGTEQIGGAFGYVRTSDIAVASTIGGSVEGYWNVGGLAGECYSSTVTDCYSDVGVNGYESVGGFVGRNYSTTIERCYSVSGVSGNLKTGAFCGELAGSASSNVITNSLCDIDRAVAGAYSAQNSTSTRYIVPVKQKSDAELEDEGYIVIHTAQEFIDAINDDPFIAIALGVDINFEGMNYTPLGTETDPFSGDFNGNGYKIKNLTIDSSEEYVGLFGSADNAYIDNVILENVNIKGDRYVGALVGKAFSTTITNSYVLGGTVEGNVGVGGLVGYADSSEITTSYTELDLVKANTNVAGGFIGDNLKTNIKQSYAKTNVETDVMGGVFSGSNNSSTIENSFAIGEVLGRDRIGGFSGRNIATTISNSYSSAKITGSVYVGAFIGEFVGNSVNNKVEDSFFDSDVAGVTDVVGSYYSADATQVATLKGMSTSQMTTPTTFTDAGWNTEVWYLYEGMMPQLRVVPGKVVLNSVGFYNSATPDQCSTLMGYATAEMKEARVYEAFGFDDEVWDIRDGAYPNLRYHFIDPFPELDPTATVADVKAVLESAVDPALANISDVATYNMFRSWANSVKVPSSAPASVLAVKDSPYAWLSFALDTDALITAAPKEGDIVIDTFESAATEGAFEFTVKIDGIAVGDNALEVNLKKVFDIEGAETLASGGAGFSTDNVEVNTATPESGNVKFTVTPKMGNGERGTGNGDKPNSFFFRVKMK